MASKFTEHVIDIIRNIPQGYVVTYGKIASMAGNSRGARGVSWILHSSSIKHDLPWHRVINRSGRISLPQGAGFEEQKALLEAEGIAVSLNGKVDLEK